MKLRFYGGARTVTGANYLLETKGKKILIDCGLFQGSAELRKKNDEPFPYSPKEVDFVLITHAHLDHIGRLPYLIKGGFKGKIFATEPTIGFAELMLEDSQKILKRKAAKEDVIPLGNGEQAAKMMKMFTPIEYEKPLKIDGIEIVYRDAGHVLGSAIIEIKSEGKKIVFSGDLGPLRLFKEKTSKKEELSILKKPALIKEADYVVMESAYGDRLHETVQSAKDKIEDIIERVVKQKSVLMIPSFALERTQRLLYHLNDLVENKRVPAIPIFVDSPLAIKLTKVYARYPSFYNKNAAKLIKLGDDIFDFPGLKLTSSVKESKRINDVEPPKIIIAGSGMSQGGRILHHELRYLSDKKNVLLIVTYQAEGTLGREILEGVKEVEVLDRKVSIKASVEHINSYSAHADRKDLMDWLSCMVVPVWPRKPSQVFVCQGEEAPATALAQLIRDHLGVSAKAPRLGQTFDL